MKRLFLNTGTFIRTLRACMKDAWQDSDSHYHIPKSRFGEPVSRANPDDGSSRKEGAAPRNAFVGSFRDCFVRAWQAADTQYHIPKSRYQDAAYNRRAYRSPVKPGLLGRVGFFLTTLKSCISASWEASDTFYHLPKSRYQDAGFIRDLMHMSPKPKGQLLYRPYTIGLGVVVGESTGKGWTIKPTARKVPEDFTVPEDMDDPGKKPELEM